MGFINIYRKRNIVSEEFKIVAQTMWNVWENKSEKCVSSKHTMWVCAIRL